jgi:hypothetical protein
LFFAVVVSEAILVWCCYFRAAGLAGFLLDGNLQGPLKRTAEELVKHDSGGQDLLGRVAMGFSEQLFSIYRNKEDPYFR